MVYRRIVLASSGFISADNQQKRQREDTTAYYKGYGR